MSKYLKRQAVSGNVTLCSARKGNVTLSYWFFKKSGSEWKQFDIREVADAVSQPLPLFMDRGEIMSCKNDGSRFETLLQRDLQRAADWLDRYDHDGAVVLDVAL